MKLADENAITAIAAYTGPVTRLPPGKARAPAETVMKVNKAVEWLKQHRRDQPVKDPKAKRHQMRMTRAHKERTAHRNAIVFERLSRRG